MKSLGKPSFLLLCLVLGIYMMRHADVSFGDLVKYPYRVLDGVRPTQTLCNGVTDINKAFTESEISRAQGFKDSLQGMRNGNPLKTLMQTTGFSGIVKDYVIPLIPFVAPWIVMLVITLITMTVLCCNWCCIYGCCKNGKACKCCKAPKDAKRKRIYIALSVFFLLGIVGSGIAGIVVSSQVPTGMELTLCSALSVIEDLTYGVKDKHWQGISGTVNTLNTLKNNIGTTASSLSSTSANMAAVSTGYTSVSSRLDTMITTLKTGTSPAPSPDPNINRPAPDQASNKYMPLYISNLNPKATTTTYTGMIDQEVKIRRDVLVTAQPLIDNAVSVIKGPDIAGYIDVGVSETNKIYNLMQDALRSMEDFGSIGKDVIKGIGIGLQAIFIVNLVLGVFGIASIIMVGIMKVKFFNKFLHLNWCILLILAIFGWILSLITYPTSLVLMEACDVLDGALKSPSEAVKLENPLGDQVGPILYTCVHGDGALGPLMGLTNVLTPFQTINDQFGLIKAQMPFVDAAPESVTIEAQLKTVLDFWTGRLADAPEIVADLTALNAAVNAGSNSCTNIYDKWELNADSCNYGTKFVSSDGDTANRGSPACMGIVNAWMSSTTGTPPTRPTTNHIIANRYTTTQFPPASCTSSNANLAYVTGAVSNFDTNRKTVFDLFQKVYSELSSVKTTYTNDFALKVKDVLHDLIAIDNGLSSIQDTLTGPQNGLLTNLNCKFVGAGLTRVADAMCVGFISGIYQSSVVIIITSTMSFFSIIFVFCLAKRFLLDSENKPKPV